MWRRHRCNRKPGDLGQNERKTSIRRMGMTSLSTKTCVSSGGAQAELHHDKGCLGDTASSPVVKTRWAIKPIQAMSKADNLALGGDAGIGPSGEFLSERGPNAL